MTTFRPYNVGPGESKFKVQLRKPALAMSKADEDSNVKMNSSDLQKDNETTTSKINYASDPILTEIVNQLNLPERYFQTPKKNFKNFDDNSDKKTNISSAINNNINLYCKRNLNESLNLIPYKVEPQFTDESTTNMITQTMANMNRLQMSNNSMLNNSEHSQSTMHQTTTNSISKSFNFERLEAKRRLELMKKNQDLINKICQVKCYELPDDDDDDDDDDEQEQDQENQETIQTQEQQQQQKFISKFSANESVVEQKITIDQVDGPISKRHSSLSSSKKKLVANQEPLKKFPKKSTKANLDAKLASVASDDQKQSSSMVNKENSNKQKKLSKSCNSLDMAGNGNPKFKTRLVKSTNSSNSSSKESLNIKLLMDVNKLESKLSKHCNLSETNKPLELDPTSVKETPPPLPKPDFSKIEKLVNRIDSNQRKNSSEKIQSKCKPTQQQNPSSSNSNNVLKIQKIYVNEKPYQILNKIGRGGSSVVYQVYCPERQHTLALKVVDLKNADKTILDGFRSEIKVLKHLRSCDRVVKMYDFEFRNQTKELLIVMEKGDADLSNVLKSHAHKNNRLSPHLIKLYWQEMLEAVKEIHENQIVHADLKPVNFILVSGKLKLIDFGIANTMQSNQTNVYKDSIIGTVDYMAPESFQKRREHNNKVKYNQKVDIWSLGIILYNLVYGVTPFSHLGSDYVKKGIAIVNGNIHYEPIGDQLLLDVIKKCLQRDPTKRPTALELLNHPYLKSTSNSTPNDAHNSNSMVDANSDIPEELLSQIRNLTPNSLKNISTIVQAFTKK